MADHGAEATADGDHGHSGHASGGKCQKAVHIMQKYSLPLVCGVVLALIMANAGPDVQHFYHNLFHSQWWHLSVMGHALSLHFIINDIFMAFFFGIAAQEITMACLPGGSLNPPVKAANPLFATLGGVLGPVTVYYLLGSSLEFGAPLAEDLCAPMLDASAAEVPHRRLETSAEGPACVFGTLGWNADDCHEATVFCDHYLENPEHPSNYTILPYSEESIMHGWGVPTATDISLAWMVASIIFGAGHPAISFLLLLAVADDGLGLIIIAVFYPDPNHAFHGEYLLLVVAGMLLAYAMRRRWVMDWQFYCLGPGMLCWFGLVGAALHPALALVPVVPFMPHRRNPAMHIEHHGEAPVTPRSQTAAIEKNLEEHAIQDATDHDQVQRTKAQETFRRLDRYNTGTLHHDEIERYLIELGETDPDDPGKCNDKSFARFTMEIGQYQEPGDDPESVGFEAFFSWWNKTGGYETAVISAALAEVEVFKGLNALACERLAKTIALCGTDLVFKKGEAIINKGDLGSDIFIMRSGVAGAYLADTDENPVRKYAAKDVFGELALLEALKNSGSTSTRAATVRALTNGTRVWSIGVGHLAAAGHEAVQQLAQMALAYASVKDEEHQAEDDFYHFAPLHLFEHHLKLPIDCGLLFFAWANAGVTIEGAGSMTYLILSSLILGKVAGICFMSTLAHSIGFPRPQGVGISEMFVVSVVASIGLTVALFVAGEAFQSTVGLERDAKLGAVLSVGAGLIAGVLGKILKVGGEADERLANMTMSEQMAELFVWSDIRKDIETEAIKSAAQAGEHAALAENKVFAKKIADLNRELRRKNKEIQDLRRGLIQSIEGLTLEQILMEKMRPRSPPRPATPLTPDSTQRRARMPIAVRPKSPPLPESVPQPSRTNSRASLQGQP